MNVRNMQMYPCAEFFVFVLKKKPENVHNLPFLQICYLLLELILLRFKLKEIEKDIWKRENYWYETFFTENTWTFHKVHRRFLTVKIKTPNIV